MISVIKKKNYYCILYNTYIYYSIFCITTLALNSQIFWSAYDAALEYLLIPMIIFNTAPQSNHVSRISLQNYGS